MDKDIRNKKGQFAKGCKINKGRKFSPDHIQNLSEAHKGYKMPQSQKEAISKANKDNPKTRGENNHRWKGGVTKCNTTGYISIYSPHHPKANRQYVLEHRLVAEKCLGRFLDTKEEVHHIDFNPANNRPENLFVFEEMGEHSRFHRCLKYGNGFLKNWLVSNIC